MSQPASISVIIPAYNSKHTIERAIESVLAQTLQPSEIIVIDDGSSDNTVEIVKEISKNLKPEFLKLIELERNNGPAYARNAGWQRARGEFLAFLDADDSWHMKKLEIQVGYMLGDNEIKLSGHQCLRLNEKDDELSLPKHWKTKAIYPWHVLMIGGFILTPSVVIRSDIAHRFNPAKRYGQDRLLWLEMLLSGCKGVKLQLPLAYTYKQPYGQAGQSENLWNLEKGELEIYTILRQDKKLTKFCEVFLKAYSLMKFLYRLLKCRRMRHV